MIKDYGSTNFITGLRALAATMVVIIHTGAFNDLGLIGLNITEAGLGGVAMFFVIAGFSVTQSFLSESNYKSYIVKRLVRIAPSYYLVLTITFLLILTGLIGIPHSGLDHGTVYDAKNYLMHLAFLSYLDKSLSNSVLSVEWTLPIEVFWYFVLPLFILAGRSWKKLLAYLILTYVIGDATKALLQHSEQVNPSWLPTRHGFYFILGIMAHKYRGEVMGKWTHWNNYLVLAGVALFMLNVVFSVGNTPRFLAVATFLFICGYNGQFSVIKSIMEGRIMLFLGSISYSIYLVHFPIIYVLQTYLFTPKAVTGFALVFALTVILSTLITRYLEGPVQKAFKRSRFNKPNLNRA